MAELRTLLMVVHDFPPLRSSGIYRPVKFARYLPDFGWKAHVLTITEPSDGPMDSALLNELPSVTRISRAKGFGLKELEQKIFATLFRKKASKQTISAPVESAEQSGSSDVTDSQQRGNILKRLLLSPLSRYTHDHIYVPDIRIGWKNPAIELGLEILRTEKIDALYSTSAPETPHLVAQELHRKSNLPWIVEYRDPWYHNFTRDHFPPTRLARELEMQRRVMQDATAIIYSAPSMRGHNKQTFPEIPDEKCVVIPNGYDEANFGDTSISYTPQPDQPLRIVHVGTIYEKSTFGAFLDGMERYYDRNVESSRPAKLVFVGDPGACWHERLTSQPLASHVEMLGFRPHKEAVRLMREADILLLTIPEDGKRFSTDYNIPGKVFELIRAERPILMIGKSGDTANIVLECTAGQVISPSDPAMISEEISRLIARKARGELRSTSNLKTLARYDRREQTRALATLLDRLVENQVKNSAHMTASGR